MSLIVLRFRLESSSECCGVNWNGVFPEFPTGVCERVHDMKAEGILGE